MVGGTFKGGDAAKAAIGRAGREAWRAAAGGGWLAWGVLALGAAAVLAEKAKPSHLARLNLRLPTLPDSDVAKKTLAYLRATGVTKLASAAVAAALWHRFYSHLVEFVTSGWITPASLANLPDILMQSRHEVSLFEWSVPSGLARAAIVLGDFLMSNPALTPPLGLAGSALMGGGLTWASIHPTTGFAINATCWGLSAACHIAFKGGEAEHPSTAVKGEFKGAEFNAVTNPSNFGKAGSSKLSIFGRSFDDVCHYVFIFAILLVRPRELSALLLLAFVYLKAPKRTSTYDRVFMVLLGLVVLLHLNTPSGLLQITRIASSISIAMLGGPYLKEIVMKEKGNIWAKVKMGWKRARS